MHFTETLLLILGVLIVGGHTVLEAKAGDDLDLPVQTCHDLKGACLFNASAIHCPQKMNGTCGEPKYYCCNMTLPPPPPRKFCSEVNGACHPNTQPYFCPHRLDATCPQGQYCCGGGYGDLDPPQPKCHDVKGECLFNASAIHCPQKMNATCDDNRHYCCNMTIPPPPTPRPPKKTCSEVQGECHPDTQPYWCPHRVDATCPQAPDGVGQYCCGAGGAGDVVGDNVWGKISHNSCSGEDGTCLSNSSRIFCPQKLDIACDYPKTYCCKLN